MDPYLETRDAVISAYFSMKEYCQASGIALLDTNDALYNLLLIHGVESEPAYMGSDSDNEESGESDYNVSIASHELSIDNWLNTYYVRSLKDKEL